MKLLYRFIEYLFPPFYSRKAIQNRISLRVAIFGWNRDYDFELAIVRTSHNRCSVEVNGYFKKGYETNKQSVPLESGEDMLDSFLVYQTLKEIISRLYDDNQINGYDRYILYHICEKDYFITNLYMPGRSIFYPRRHT